MLRALNGVCAPCGRVGFIPQLELLAEVLQECAAWQQQEPAPHLLLALFDEQLPFGEPRWYKLPPLPPPALRWLESRPFEVRSPTMPSPAALLLTGGGGPRRCTTTWRRCSSTSGRSAAPVRCRSR